MKFAGWTNKATWKIALLLDNNQIYHDVTQDIIKTANTEANHAMLLLVYISDIQRLKNELLLEGLQLKNDVNWNEIISNYQAKAESGTKRPGNWDW